MKFRITICLLAGILVSLPLFAGTSTDGTIGLATALFIVIVSLVAAAMLVVFRVKSAIDKQPSRRNAVEDYSVYLKDLNAEEIRLLVEARKSLRKKTHARVASFVTMLLVLTSQVANAQSPDTSLMTQPGIIITIVLLAIPLVVAVLFLISRINRIVSLHYRRQRDAEAERLADYLVHLEGAGVDPSLIRRRASLENRLTGQELSGDKEPDDPKGLIARVAAGANIPFVPVKKKAVERPGISPDFARMIIWYLGTAIFWLVFGTTVGEYLGIKFLAPDMDHQSWLSFGRLRPVHTNAVFWGWSSLAMIGLGHYVVSIVSNTRIASMKMGWTALVLINAAVALGTVSLMAGINNGGGEYREYIWPIMALFGAGLVVTLINFIKTISGRKTHEIYVSNWYIVSAVIFTLVIAFIAYWPTWQNGLGETIVQGYYMHQGVGMWFMLYTLGVIYYFLPQQLNKPIYSYSLGILAFWTQVLFYTVIGTHHFVFSSIPWSLQTVAIVGSMGMVIPVVAGTTNFLMTFKGDFNRLSGSYTLPFFLVGIVFYFTGSLQGTAEAFRFTNLLWHFTDFTVAHSHMTMYGIIAFIMWGSIYALVPRLTGREPSLAMVGAHFWLAFVGLLLYSVPLMIGGTLKGLMWMDGKPFIESVTMMAPYWLWRAIGGSMMWLSHLIFAYNFYRMLSKREDDIRTLAFTKIKKLIKLEPEANLLN